MLLRQSAASFTGGDKAIAHLFWFGSSYNSDMSRRYEITRSAADRHLQLVYLAGLFEGLPFEVRLHAPWVGGDGIDIATLRPEQRNEIAQQGYAIFWSAAALLRAA